MSVMNVCNISIRAMFSLGLDPSPKLNSFIFLDSFSICRPKLRPAVLCLLSERDLCHIGPRVKEE